MNLDFQGTAKLLANPRLSADIPNLLASPAVETQVFILLKEQIKQHLSEVAMTSKGPPGGPPPPG